MKSWPSKTTSAETFAKHQDGSASWVEDGGQAGSYTSQKARRTTPIEGSRTA